MAALYLDNVSHELGHTVPFLPAAIAILQPVRRTAPERPLEIASNYISEAVQILGFWNDQAVKGEFEPLSGEVERLCNVAKKLDQTLASRKHLLKSYVRIRQQFRLWAEANKLASEASTLLRRTKYAHAAQLVQCWKASSTHACVSTETLVGDDSICAKHYVKTLRQKQGPYSIK